MALLPDAAEGLLEEGAQCALDSHLAACEPCTAELAEAQRGLAWLTVLKQKTPTPPPDLLANILARTTGRQETGVSLPPMPMMPVRAVAVPAIPVIPIAHNAWEVLGRWLRAEEGTWSSLLQPQLTMTAATAFFSICLTLNLFGVSVAQLDAQGLRSGSLKRTVDDRRASLVRSFEGLRLVYRVESRVNAMRARMDIPVAP